MNYILEHRKGLVGTIVTHAVILIMLLSFGFFNPIPLANDEGILVNFGDSETGLGLEEPAPGESAPAKGQDLAIVEKQTPPPAKKVATPAEKEALLTQEMEKTVALESAAKEKEVKKVKDLEKEQLWKEKLEQRELERQQQAEINQQKKVEEQRLAQIASEQRKAGEIDSRAKNAFGGNGKGAANSKSTSQGVTYGTGNQGSPNGSANVDKYGPGGGVGNGSGPSFSLDGRSGLSLPKPFYPGNEEGIVVVQVTVDKNGTVTKVEPGVKGSNTANTELIAAARKAALQAKFNVDNNAPAFQVGTITYRFRLD